MADANVLNDAATTSTIDLSEVSCVISECAAVLSAAADKCLLEGDGHQGYRAIYALVERVVLPAVEKLVSDPTTGEAWNDAMGHCQDAYWLLTNFNNDGCDDMLLYAAERLLKSAINDLNAWEISARGAEVQHGSV